MSNVSILLFTQGEGWNAQCLEYDIAAQGVNLHQAMNEVIRAYVSELAVCRELGVDISESIKPAPKWYWNKYAQG